MTNLTGEMAVAAGMSVLMSQPLKTLEAIARLYRDIVAADPDGLSPFSDVDRAYLADVEAVIAIKTHTTQQ